MRYNRYNLYIIVIRIMAVSYHQNGILGPTNIRGVDLELWRWLKAQAALEGKTIGQKLNEILAEAKRDSQQKQSLFPQTEDEQ